MNVLRGAFLPVACALLQTLTVGTGLPERSAGAAATAVMLGIASGLALFARAAAPFAVLAATVVGYLAQVLAGGPALPVAVSVMMFVVARGYTGDDHRRHNPRPGPSVRCSLDWWGCSPTGGDRVRFRGALYGLLCSMAGAAGLLVALRAGREQQRRNELVMAERLRIARDLHDVVGHGMGAITVQAGAARMAVAAGAVDDASRALATSRRPDEVSFKRSGGWSACCVRRRTIPRCCTYRTLSVVHDGRAWTSPSTSTATSAVFRPVSGRRRTASFRRRSLTCCDTRGGRRPSCR
jgi:signal transduction histidine kinase